MEQSNKKRGKTQKTRPAPKCPSTLRTMFDKYKAATPVKLKLIDSYLLYACASAAIQLVYVGLVGTYPFNSFLSGFLSCVATVVVAVSLRSQVNPLNAYKFPNISHEKAFAEFVFFHIVLHLTVINFIG